MIADLRMRLLDLSNGNKLLSYKHSERGKTQVRIVDELPDALAEQLAAANPMYFRALPEPKNELPDEINDEFLLGVTVGVTVTVHLMRWAAWN